MSKFPKITDFEGERLRIVPTNFTKVQAKFFSEPVEVVYADVTVLRALDEEIILTGMPIYQRGLVAQIKNAWTGKPITGTLVMRAGRVGQSRGVPLWQLDDVEVD